MSSNRSVTYSLYLNSNVRESLIQTESAAKSLDSVMYSLNNTMRMFGLGFLGAEIISAAKDAVQGAADYESAMLRIKNSTKDASDGIKDQFFITEMVDKYKLDLQGASDAYGKFLGMLAQSHIPMDELNKLHENVLIVSKVLNVPQSTMDAGIRNIGKQLEDGILDARHLFALMYEMPGLAPVLAEKMGLSQQELAKAISSGELKKSAIDSRILLDVMDELAGRLKDKLPESLKSTQSELNDLNNKWLMFKNDFVLEHKDDLVEFFNSLKDVIKWISEHKEALTSVGVTIIELVKYYAIWRASIMLMQVPFGLVGFARNEMGRLAGATSLYTASLVSNTTASTANAAAIDTHSAALSAYSEIQAKSIPIQQELDALRLKQIELDNQFATQHISLADALIESEAVYNENTLQNFQVQNTLKEEKIARETLYNEEFLNTQANLLTIQSDYELKNANLRREYNAILAEIEATRYNTYTGAGWVGQQEKLNAIEAAERERLAAHLESIQVIQTELVAQEQLYNQKIEILQNEHLRKTSTIKNLEVDAYVAFNNEMQLLRLKEFTAQEEQAAKQAALQAEMLEKQTLYNEEMIAEQNAANIAMMESYASVGASVGGAGILASGRAALGSTGVSAASLINGAISVFVVGMAADLFAKNSGLFEKQANGSPMGLWDSLPFSGYSKNTDAGRLREIDRMYGNGTNIDDMSLEDRLLFHKLDKHRQFGVNPEFDKNNNLIPFEESAKHLVDAAVFLNNVNNSGALSMFGFGFGGSKAAGSVDSSYSSSGHIVPKLKKQSEHVRGNTVTNITINIHEMNGIKTTTISSKDAESKMGYNMLNNLTRVVNQSQIVK